jgi:3-hydroxyacyl-[acyl-carrier-protein] dehydratase
MTAPIDIEVDDAWFEGHFPGRPILPGVSQLALVFEALAKAQGRPLPVSGIAFARMRQPVVPGNRLQLTASMRPDGTIRFALTRAGEAVTNGELRTTPPEGKALPRIATGGRPGERPPPDMLLPHRPPMRFITAVLDESEEHFTTEAIIPSACRLAAGPGVPAVAAIEAAAQTAALWEAVRRASAQPSSRPRVGYLVGLRDVTFHVPRIPAGVPFVVSVRFEAATPPLAHYAMQVELEGKPVLDGTLATWLTEETLPA